MNEEQFTEAAESAGVTDIPAFIATIAERYKDARLPPHIAAPLFGRPMFTCLPEHKTPFFWRWLAQHLPTN